MLDMKFLMGDPINLIQEGAIPCKGAQGDGSTSRKRDLNSVKSSSGKLNY